MATAGLPAAPASAADVACGQVITEDTTLENDLTGCTTPASLAIGAPGITLDLGGHRIETGRSSVVNPGHDGVTIQNGTVTGDDGAIRLEGARRNVIRDLRFEGLLGGAVLVGSDRNRIVSNELPGIGIQLLQGSDRNVVKGNALRYPEGYVGVAASHHNRIVDNELRDSDGAIKLQEAHRNRIARNDITAFLDGILLFESRANELVDNVIRSDPQGFGRGLELHESSGNRLLRNAFVDTAFGIRLVSGQDNDLRHNLAVNGSSDGFVVEAAAGGTLLHANTAIGYDDDGVDIEAPATVLRRNTANGNGDLGIEAVAGVVDGGGNRASGNGNPLQCANVFCR